MKKIISISFLLITVAFNSIGQSDPTPLNSDTASINNQYDFLMEESRTYVNNKVIKTEWIKKFYQNISDSLSTTYKNNQELEKALVEEKTMVSEIQTELDNTKEELSVIKKEKDSLSFLGSQFSKGGYQAMTWSIIFILFALLLFFAYKFKNSISTTKNAKKDLANAEEELEETNKKFRTKEQELMRKLQDEINKHS